MMTMLLPSAKDDPQRQRGYVFLLPNCGLQIVESFLCEKHHVSHSWAHDHQRNTGIGYIFSPSIQQCHFYRINGKHKANKVDLVRHGRARNAVPSTFGAHFAAMHLTCCTSRLNWRVASQDACAIFLHATLWMHPCGDTFFARR